jgi:subtilisin-like proprotein convertase family protein
MSISQHIICNWYFWNLISVHTCLTPTCFRSTGKSYYSLSSRRTVSSSVIVKGSACSISTLEHVQVELSFSYSDRRGDISLVLVSPSGTISLLMTPRPDDSTLTKNMYTPETLIWTFTSVQFWGENMSGTWKLIMSTKRTTLFHKGWVKSKTFDITLNCYCVHLWYALTTVTV